MKKTVAVCLGVVALAATAAAQIPDRLDRALTAILDRNEYTPDSLPSAVWLENGGRYATIDATGLIAYDTASGTATTLATSEQLNPAGMVSGFTFSSDASKVLLFTNTRKVWRLNTRGDYWVLDLRTHKLQQIGRGAPPSTLMFAKFSPDGTRVAFVRQQNIYVEDLAGGRVSALTNGREPNVINGTSDWVNEEEVFIRDAFKWSPDGRQIAYLQFDTSRVGRFTLIYQERYMGLPQDNPEAYRLGSSINFAEGLRGRLLLMHGTGDDNVHLQNTERLMNRLIELGKDFDVMFYPNRTHALSEGPGTPLHRWRTIARYLLEHLAPAANPSTSAAVSPRP